MKVSAKAVGITTAAEEKYLGEKAVTRSKIIIIIIIINYLLNSGIFGVWDISYVLI